MGIPSVTLVTPPFVPALTANARMLGLPTLAYVVVPNDYYEETVELPGRAHRRHPRRDRRRPHQVTA